MTVIRYDHKVMEKEVVGLWNSCLIFDPITVNKFRKQAIFDENFDNDLCYVYLEEDKVVGFVLATKRKFPYLERGLEPEKGWINVLFVDKQYQNRGIGKQLLNTVEEKLISYGVKNISLAAYSPNYFFAGIDEENYPEAKRFFLDNGYVSYEKHYSMGMNLHGFNLSDKAKEEKRIAEEKGYKFQPFTYDYSIELLEFLKNEFGGGWKRNALIAMQKDKAEDRLFLVINPQGKICGCANRAIDDNEMRFGPIGISKKERNNGLGTILLETALYEMTKKGIYRMFFMTTDEAGKRYYLRAGLEVIRTFTTYRKELSLVNND